MRSRSLAILLTFSALVGAPRHGAAQISATLQLGQQNWGPEIRVYPYAPDVDGDWRTAYRRWQPVTLYSLDGRFYARAVPGGRAVAVYRWNNQYFLPPRDAAWVNFDQRYRYDRRPQDADYDLIDRLIGVFGGRPSPAWGAEVVVNPYAPERYGDWRTMYRRWTPVTLYFRGNRYFARAVPGSRPVAVYSMNGQYFLPPQDQQWDGFDRRYNYGRRPISDDYDNVQRVPGQYGQQPPPAGYDPQRGNPPAAEIVVSSYAPRVHGDWRTAYNSWEPVTVFSLNGRFYASQQPGARQVMVYRSQNQYFLPPQDPGWNYLDRRYDYRLRPNSDDYRSARPEP